MVASHSGFRHTIRSKGAQLLFLCCVLGWSASVAAQEDAQIEAARQEFARSVAEGRAVGAALLVSRGGRQIIAAYSGKQDAAAGVPVDADTAFHWASITKLFTAVSILQLRDRGRLSLDDRIVDYLPEARQIHDPHGSMNDVTLRHLLTHSSGMPAATFPWSPGKPWMPREPRDWSQVAAMMPYTELKFAPGSQYSYSNPGISMLGRVIEIVTGDDVEVYVSKNILMPLGMSRTYFDTAPYYLRPHRSANYEIKDGKIEAGNPDVDTGATHANGGLNGPLGDLMIFGNFLAGVNDNGRYETVLSRKSVEEMFTPAISAGKSAAGTTHMGFGTFIITPASFPPGAPPLVGHTGSQANFLSFLYVDPQSRSVAAFATNTYNDDAPFEKGPFYRTTKVVTERLFPGLRAGPRP